MHRKDTPPRLAGGIRLLASARENWAPKPKQVTSPRRYSSSGRSRHASVLIMAEASWLVDSAHCPFRASRACLDAEPASPIALRRHCQSAYRIASDTYWGSPPLRVPDILRPPDRCDLGDAPRLVKATHHPRTQTIPLLRLCRVGFVGRFNH